MRKYLLDNEHSDMRDIILRNKEILGIPTSQLFEQIAVRRKAREKLPLYYNTPNIIYPPQENFEQSSSETTARFKSGIAAGILGDLPATGADLTGGFGVDTYFFSKVWAHVHCVEPNESLLNIGKFNHELLGAGNITYHPTTAEDFVATGPGFDFTYIDPSRRTGSGKRIVGFESARPDVGKLAPAILGKSRCLMIKASPLLDIQAGIAQLPNFSRVYVVSVGNECKELLFLCEASASPTPQIETVNILSDGSRQTFNFTFEEERSHNAVIREPSQYLYEPNASIMKAGAFKTVGARFGVSKVHTNTHLYSSSRLIEDFPGKRFRIEAFVRPQKTEVRKYFEDGYANVTTRNFPLSAEALASKVGVRAGGDKFLIAFTGPTKKYTVVAERIV